MGLRRKNGKKKFFLVTQYKRWKCYSTIDGTFLSKSNGSSARAVVFLRQLDRCAAYCAPVDKIDTDFKTSVHLSVAFLTLLANPQFIRARKRLCFVQVRKKTLLGDHFDTADVRLL